MKILITLFFNSEFGGLHDNIRATAIEAMNRGYEVYVGCRSGAFFDQLVSDGIHMIETDDNDIDQSAQNIIDEAGTDIDLIHAHPGAGREIAMNLHGQYDIPVIFHIHGAWVNAVEEYIDELACVFAVSESVKRKVIERTDGNVHKVYVIPNYSDYIYKGIKGKEKTGSRKSISLITRIEKDKQHIMDEVKKLCNYLDETAELIDFNIIGEGSLRESFVQEMNAGINNENVVIHDIGWIEDKDELQSYIENSDIIIGPGRVAIDAFTLQTPVIVVGSQNYHGLIDKDNWQHFVSANFGGYGSKPEAEADIVSDLDTLLADEKVYKKTVDIGKRAVDLFFNKEKTLEKMFGVYEMVRGEKG